MDYKKIGLNAVCTGVVAVVATNVLFGSGETVSYYGMSIPSTVATGIACGVGSVASDTLSEMVIKKLNVSNQIMNGSTLAVKGAVGGLASAGVLYFGGMPVSILPTALVFGAGAKLGGDYVNEKVFDARTGFIPLF